jgi:hypothetical protein
MNLEIDTTALLLTAKRFKGFKAGLQRAIEDGLNQGGGVVATRVRKALFVQTGVTKYKSITSRTRTVFLRGPEASYTIVATGKGIPIEEFKTSIQSGSGGGVVSFPWAQAHRFKRSFSKDGTVAGARARTTSKRFPLRKLYGPSVAKEAMEPVIVEGFKRSVVTEVAPRILLRIAKVTGAPS